MSTPHQRLDKTFKEALQEAAKLDQQHVLQDDDFEFFTGQARTNVQLVKECVAFYDQHQVVIDAALAGAVKFTRTPAGIAHVRALAASFESSGSNALSIELASKILHSEEFDFAKHRDNMEALQGVGIGISAGAAIPQAGVLAGADVVFGTDVVARAWAGVHGESDPSTGSIDLGLELSFLTNMPTDGVITGSLIDFYWPYSEFPLIVFVRLMLIKQKLTKEGDFIPIGLLVQLPLGLNWQPQQQVEVKTYFARQWATKPKPQFATLSISPSQVLSKGPAVNLSVKLTNTSTQDVTLRKGDTITLTMPDYFQSSEVATMKVDGLPGWNLTQSGKKLTMTLNNPDPWVWANQATIPAPAGFSITNVKTSYVPSGPSEIGIFNVWLTYRDSKIPVVKNAELDVVTKISTGKITNWSVDLGSATDFEWADDKQPHSGANVPIQSAPNAQVQKLTQVKQISTGVVWTLGFIYDADPWFSAAGYRGGPRTRANFYESDQISGSGTVSSFFQKHTGIYPLLTITVGPLTAP